MRIIIAIVSVILSFASSVHAQADAVGRQLLALEYEVFKSDTNILQAREHLYAKACLLTSHDDFTGALLTLERIKYAPDTIFEPKLNRLKAEIYFKLGDFALAYNYMQGSVLTTRADSLLFKILLIENLRVKELLDTQYCKTHAALCDSILTQYTQYSIITDADCEIYFTKSRRLPASGLFAQRSYRKGLISLGLIGGSLAYGAYYAWIGHYATSVLTGGVFAFKFYKSGARLSYNVCLEKQKRAKDEFKAYLYRLLLSGKL